MSDYSEYRPHEPGTEFIYRRTGERVRIDYLSERSEFRDDVYQVSRKPGDAFFISDRELGPCPGDQYRAALDDLRRAGPMGALNNLEATLVAMKPGGPTR